MSIRKRVDKPETKGAMRKINGIGQIAGNSQEIALVVQTKIDESHKRAL